MSGDQEIDALLSNLGYSLPASKAKARATLEEAQLTRQGKTRMSNEKMPRVEALLREKFFLHCARPECIGYAKGSGREPLAAEPSTRCERCGGSSNKRAETELVEEFRRRGLSKLCIVGGSPSVREELESALGSQIELRMVDGTERRTSDRAKADLEWADMLLLWGASELHHKVSTLYSNAGPPLKRKVVHVAKRGIAALLAEAVEHVRRM